MKKKLLTLTFTLVLLIGLVAAMGMNASAATCPIEGATGTGTEADPVVVDNTTELQKALEYNGTLYIDAKFSTSSSYMDIELPFAEISSKKVLNFKNNIEIKYTGSSKGSLFSVKNGGDLTIIADDTRKVKFNYTILELAGSTAKATLKGDLNFETTTNDGTGNFALVAHQGRVLLDGRYLKISSASLQNGAAVLKNGQIKGKVALKGKAFNLYRGSVGFLNDKDTAFTEVPDFGTAGVVREDLRAACIGGFNEQNPALETDSYTTGIKLTAGKEKFFLGISKKYSFKTANNTAWAEDFVYTPTGTIQVTDSAGNVIYSKTDSDSGTFDENVSLSIDLKDVIKTAGEYQIKETIKLTRDGKGVTQHVNVYPIEVVEFNAFLGQSPAMPSGKTEYDLGAVSKTSYPITFYSHSLTAAMKDEGYTSNAILKIYNENDSYIYGYKAYCNRGTDKVNYDLNNLAAGKYKIVETVQLTDKDGKKVKEATNIFYIDWTPLGAIKTVNVSAKWSGAPAAATSSTKGVKVTYTKWEKWNATISQWETATNITEGNQYRCMIELTPESGYELASGYTVKIGGFTAKRYSGNVWYVSRSITRVVSDVYVYDLARPEVGAYPDFTGDEQSADTAFDKAEWFPCTANGTKTGDALTADDKFDEGFYRLEVTVKPPKGQDVVFEEQWLNVSTYDFGCLDINGDTPSWFYPDPEDHSVFTMWIVYHTDDAEGSYKLDLGGVTMKDGDYLALGASAVTTTKPSGGYAYYKDGVLTLNNYNGGSFTDPAAKLVFKERHLEINLIGENELNSIVNGHYYFKEYDVEDIEDPYCLTIGGEGSLRIGWYGDPSYVFAVNGDINFTGGKIRFYDGGYCGTYKTKNITISGGAEVEFQAYSYGLTWGGIETLAVEDGSFYAFDGGSWENKWINQEISIPKGYVYVYDYGSTLNPINPGIGAPKLYDSHKWDGVTPIGKYDNVWILSEEICLHSYDNACDAVCNDCGESRTPAAHTGGTATCTKKAQCTECAASYGSLKAHTYKNVTTKATLSKNGKVESKCSVCGNVSKTTTVYYPKTIKLSKTEYTYNGKVQTPSVTVKDTAGDTLKKDTDYTVSYEKGRKVPGKYTVKITFKGKYDGVKRLYFTIKPRATSKITASQTTTTITLKWSKVTGADAYRVYKYNSKTKKYEKLKDVTKTTLKISKLKAGTAYKYKVRAITKDDGSIYGAYSDVFATATKCKTPSISKLTSSKKGVASLTWTNVSGESGYQVYYSTKKDSGYKKVASYKVNVVKGSKKKLKSGKKYYFKVRAYKKTASGTVYSSWSAVKSIKIK
ncbi:MAG: hypothetical protein E7538_08355 [Ruminococcaceae bacterium]|nr:hypothetical protein [Oscillospiraceae bacterium]